MTSPNAGKSLDVFQLNDLDHPPLPTDFADYRDLMVIDREGQDIGRIADVLINRADRKPLMAIVSFGGFMDIGAKHVLIPYQWLHDATPTTIHADFVRAQAEVAPDFDPHSKVQLEAYFQYWFPGEVEPTADPALQPIKENSARGHGPLLRIARANEWQIPRGIVDLRGCEVVDENGARVGVIDDWFLNLTEEAPEIVVVRHGGLMGFLGHESMIPFDRMEVVDPKTYRSRITAEELAGAPELKDEIYDFEPFFQYWGTANKPTGRPTAAAQAVAAAGTEPTGSGLAEPTHAGTVAAGSATTVSPGKAASPAGTAAAGTAPANATGVPTVEPAVPSGAPEQSSTPASPPSDFSG